MKFRVLVKRLHAEFGAKKAGDTWWEPYDDRLVRTLEDAQEWADRTVDSFNRSLRPRESPRAVLKVELLGPGSNDHRWERFTGLRTEVDVEPGKCFECGVLGQRSISKIFQGLEGWSRVEPYTRSEFADCESAKEFLGRVQRALSQACPLVKPWRCSGSEGKPCTRGPNQRDKARDWPHEARLKLTETLEEATTYA